MDDSISEFDDSVWGGAVESMTIQEKGKAVVRFKGGIEIEALEFIAPVSLMIQLHDREPNRKKEILKTIKKHMDEFINRYF